MNRPKFENYSNSIEYLQGIVTEPYVADLEKYCDELEHGNYKEFKGRELVTREECEKACMYLLKHCYETDAPALENGDKDKTYTFTPAGFGESRIFAKLIEEHFNNSVDFKHFKLHSDSTLYQKFTKKELISYIHMLYHNWQVSDNWCDNLLEANHELSNKTEVLLKTNNDKETFEYPEVNREKIYKKLEECSRGWHINNKDLIPWDDVIKVVDKLIDDNNKMIANYTEEMAMRKPLEFELFKKFEELEDAFTKNELPNFVIYDKNNEIPLEIKSINSQNKMLTCFVGGYDGLYDFEFKENRYYLVQMPSVGD